jgi:hypothetical protein
MEPQDTIDFTGIPRWALTAFIARCARRLLPLYEKDNAEPIDQRTVVSRAVLLAEKRATMGGDTDAYEYEQLWTDGQFVDNYDIDALAAALAGAEQAAANTFSDIGSDPSKAFDSSQVTAGEYTGIILSTISLARLAFQAAFGRELSLQEQDFPGLAGEAVKEVREASKSLKPELDRDLELIRSRARDEEWNDQTGVSPDVFGELWPAGRPAGRPLPQLSFRPRARIIRTIGDGLISVNRVLNRN